MLSSSSTFSLLYSIPVAMVKPISRNGTTAGQCLRTWTRPTFSIAIPAELPERLLAEGKCKHVRPHEKRTRDDAKIAAS